MEQCELRKKWYLLVKNMKFTCEGNVRGCCKIKHRSLDAAEICCAKDGSKIRFAYPNTFPTQSYSDRRPVPLDNEAKVLLSAMWDNDLT